MEKLAQTGGEIVDCGSASAREDPGNTLYCHTTLSLTPDKGLTLTMTKGLM